MVIHNKKPSREILESIVADVLERFGFRVETNRMAKTREGREIEVDVWGIKTIENTRFYVYVSCKNWDKKVDRNVIFSEIGRISSLIQQPHLKIFVCKELTDPARETALTDGFIVIELREKANSENTDEIAEIIYNHLNFIFTGGTVTPALPLFETAPKLLRIAKGIAEEAEADKTEIKAHEINKNKLLIKILILIIFILVLIYLYFNLFII